VPPVVLSAWADVVLDCVHGEAGIAEAERRACADAVRDSAEAGSVPQDLALRACTDVVVLDLVHVEAGTAEAGLRVCTDMVPDMVHAEADMAEFGVLFWL
jgi:hypothetical protein